MRTSLVLKEILGTSERFAIYVLSGQRLPGRGGARKLADALDLSLEQVLFPEENGLCLPDLIRARISEDVLEHGKKAVL